MELNEAVKGNYQLYLIIRMVFGSVIGCMLSGSGPLTCLAALPSVYRESFLIEAGVSFRHDWKEIMVRCPLSVVSLKMNRLWKGLRGLRTHLRTKGTGERKPEKTKNEES